MEREVRWAAVATALVALSALPQAAALDATGSFSVVGGIEFPQGSVLQGSPLALFLRGDAAQEPTFAEFRFTASEMTVWVVQEERLEVDGGLLAPGYLSLSKRNDTYVLHNVTVSLLDQRPGAFVGADLSRGGLLALEGGGSVEARDRSALASHEATNPSASRDLPYYHREIREPHLLSAMPGGVRYEGGLSVKMSNMVLLLDAEENATRIVAESDPPEGATGRNFRSWVVLESRDAVLEATSEQPWSAALVDGEVEWSGQVRFRCVSGALTAAGRTSRTTAGPVALDGAFAGSLLPDVGSGLARGLLTMRGELATSTMAASANGVASLGPSPFLLPWLALVGGTVVAVGAGALVLRRRRRAPVAATLGSTPEECVQRANDLIQAGYYTAATRWLAKARRLAPTSASVCASQAFVLGEVGKVEEALQAYLEASRLDPSEGEHALSAARLSHKAGRRPELVEDLLEQALARSPRLVEEIESDGYFEGLAGRPRFDHLLERAWRRHTANLSAPDDAEEM